MNTPDPTMTLEKESTFPKCRTCKHWGREINGSRLCEKVSDMVRAGPLHRIMAIEPTEGILTDSDFGCCLHESIEGGKEDWKPFHQLVIENPDAYKGCGQF
jgi:hypothetical protein